MSWLSETAVPTLERQAVSGKSIGAIADLIVTDSMKGQRAGGEDRTAREQTKYFRYWNYVALSRIAKYCSNFFPNLSYQPGAARSTDRGGNQTFYQRNSLQWLKRNYRQRITQGAIDVQELKPIPEDHQMISLLSNPNDYAGYSMLAQEFTYNKRMTGRAYLWVIPNRIRTQFSPNGLPAELHVIPTQWVEPQFADNGTLAHYLVTPEGDTRRQMKIPPEDIIKQTNVHPVDKLNGQSEVQAGARWIENAEDIEKSRRASFINGRNPDVIVSLDEDKFKGAETHLSKDELILRIKERFRQRTRGVERHGDPLVQPPGVDISPWSMTPQEMDYPSSADAMRDNILALYGVHHIIAGLSTDYNRATSEAAWAVFCEISANPELNEWAESLQELANRWDPRIVVWFDDCTPENAEQAFNRMRAGVDTGAVTLDEFRMFLNLEPMKLPEYETAYMPSARLPVALALEPEPLEDEPDPEDDEVDEDEPDDSEDDEADESDDEESEDDE